MQTLADTPVASRRVPSRFWRWRPQTLPLGVSVVGALAFLLLCVRAAPIKSPIWLDGCILDTEQAIASGRIYQAAALAFPPYVVVTHPPLSYLLAYPLFAEGWGAPGLRCLNMLVILIDALLIYILARAPDRRGLQPCAWFAATVFLTCPPVFQWSQLIRCPDALSCAFDLSIVWLLLRPSSGARREVLIGLLFVLAILSKQSALLTFGPVLVLEPLLRRQRFHLTLLRWGATILPIAAFTWCMQRWSGGGFLTNVVNANVMQANFIRWTGDVVIELGFLWLLALVVFRLAKKLPKLIVWWFAVSATAGVLTDWKDGANSVYFFEASAALAVLAGYALSSALERDRRRSIWQCASLAVPVLLILSYPDARAWHMSAPENVSQYVRLVDFLRSKQTNGRQVLTQDPSVSHVLGEPALWNDPLVLGALNQQGRWDDRYIVSGLEQAKFYAAVELVDHYWTPEMKKALDQHYYAAAVFGGTFTHVVYLPRP